MQLKLDKIEKVLSFLDAESKDLILLGDTNCDFGSKENDCLTQGDAKPEWPTNPGRPWITLDFVCPWKTLKLRPTPEKYVLKQIFRASIFWLAVLFHFLFL